MQQQGQARQAHQLPDTQLALQVTSPWPAQTPWLAKARPSWHFSYPTFSHLQLSKLLYFGRIAVCIEAVT
jgi:hypothetical protein